MDETVRSTAKRFLVNGEPTSLPDLIEFGMQQGAPATTRIKGVPTWDSILVAEYLRGKGHTVITNPDVLQPNTDIPIPTFFQVNEEGLNLLSTN